MRKQTFFLSFIAFFASIFMASCSSGNRDSEAKEVKAEKIIEQIKKGKNIMVVGKTIKGKLDFTKIQSQNKKIDVSAVYIPVEICFKNCVFEDSVVAFSQYADGKKDMVSVFERNVLILDCEFKDALVISQSSFRGRFDFDLSKVAGEADFSGSYFGNGVSFCQANFNGDAYFVSCNFCGRANFLKSFFRNGAVFQHVRFGEAVMFADSHFYGGVDMSKITATSYIDFSNAKFSGNLNISHSKYLDDLRLISCTFSKAFTFASNKVFGKLNLQKSQFGTSVSVSDNLLVGEAVTTDIEKSDVCEVLQQGNKIVNYTEKSIF